MAVEEGGDGDFGAVEGLGDGFEGEGFGGFGVEESLGGDGEAVDQGALWGWVSGCLAAIVCSGRGVKKRGVSIVEPIDNGSLLG